MIFDENAPGANQQSAISIEMPTSLAGSEELLA
jgi:hypothetical protein